jgi:hypothetical protein
MEDVELYKRLNALFFEVGSLERKVDFLFKHLGVAYVDTRPPPTDIEKLLVEGNATAAAKLYLTKHNVGLLDAKRAIDEIKAKLGL